MDRFLRILGKFVLWSSDCLDDHRRDNCSIAQHGDVRECQVLEKPDGESPMFWIQDYSR